jgi:agmatine deiminase
MSKQAKPPVTWQMPAEWGVHHATWLAWPHNGRDWPGKIATIHWVYGEIVRKLAAGEMVHILVNDAKHEDAAWRVLGKWEVDFKRIRFFRYATNRGWTRDMGPIFVVPTREGADKPLPLIRDHRGEGPHVCKHDLGEAPKESKLGVARFRFNGWAKYHNWQKDDAVPECAARDLNCALRSVERDGRGVVLEGGSIDVNGRGTLLTTEECLLDAKVQVRNPGFAKADYEAVFREALGVTHTIWLGRGIAGDDTHGHVDDLARFVNARTIVVAREPRAHDENHAVLEENWERLQGARLEDGSRPEVVALPMPRKLVFDTLRLPASYANFYIANAGVLVPTFNDENDRVALGILGELFPDRPVVGIHAVDLVWGLGTLHCLTQQQPAV